MSEITVKDFEGLNLKQFAEKLQEVDSIELLSAIEEAEKAGEARKGAISAINERQGVLVDKAPPVQKSDIEEAYEIAFANGFSGSFEDYKNSFTKEFEEDDQEIDEAAAELEKALSQDIKQTEPVKETTITTPVGVEVLFTEGSNQKILAPEEKSLDELAKETYEKVIPFVKKSRLEIDRVLQYAEAHFGVSVDCEKPLFLAKSWLGKLLFELGDKNPYAVDVKTTKDIPATAEKNEGIEFEVAKRHFSNLNTLQAVVELINDLEMIIHDIQGITATRTREGAIARTNAYTYACEAKFFLGTDLARLRN